MWGSTGSPGASSPSSGNIFVYAGRLERPGSTHAPPEKTARMERAAELKTKYTSSQTIQVWLPQKTRQNIGSVCAKCDFFPSSPIFFRPKASV